ncbi:MAG: DUF1540 domain-containing protein [Clostridiaceae bacterium]|nr:DUF1540 domain-containing protein [Clostridiaceae bacterium]
MTDLKCSATTCQHNQSNLCVLNAIHVDGSAACHSSETSCSSFAPKTNSFTNSVNKADAKPETKIKCHAQECVYNKDMLCSADSVQISGPSADRAVETECATFKAR